MFMNKTNRYSSIKHSHRVNSAVAICCSLKRPSSVHLYKNFKMRYGTVQVVLVVGDPI